MAGKYMGIIALPHPRKIFRAARIAVSLVFLALGLIGMLHVFYAKIIPEKIISLLSPALYSVSRENIILVSAFILIILGLVLLSRKENF